jgi:phage FluMu protein Com
MKADEKGLIDQKAFRCTSINFIYFLRTECAEVIHQVQLQRKTEQQVMLSSEGFRKSAFNSSSDVYIQDSIKFDQIYSDIDTRQLTGLRL